MTVVRMSERELTRLRVMIDLADGPLTPEAAGTLMDIDRRQVFRLRRAFEAGGAGAGSDSRALSGFRSDVGFTGAHNQTKESIKSTQRASPRKFDQ
jgi:hypothetical protein